MAYLYRCDNCGEEIPFDDEGDAPLAERTCEDCCLRGCETCMPDSLCDDCQMSRDLDGEDEGTN